MSLSLAAILIITISQDIVIGYDFLEEIAAAEYLIKYNRLGSEQCNALQHAEWSYMTNLTEQNKEKLLKQQLIEADFKKSTWEELMTFNWKEFRDPVVKRQFKLLSILGNAALPPDKLKELNGIVAEMTDIYGRSKICPYNVTKNDSASCNQALEPDLTTILQNSRNYGELLHVWKSWRDVVGRQVKTKYGRFVNLANEAARLNGFSDAGEYWRNNYESETFQKDIEELWEQVRPLYLQLHAYVRRKLIKQYGQDEIRSDGPIPAHLLGNMWAQDWSNVYEIVKPFPNSSSLDITPGLKSKNMTPVKIAKLAEEFFTSLGLYPMTKDFWEKSVFEKPKDREIVCHASAWDFCNGKDFRLKQCTEITMEYLITTHHEMGHVQYYMQYAPQPSVFRQGANPGFHEAIGDVMALSVATPKHLKTIGLLNDVSNDEHGDINYMLKMALRKVAFLPFGYIIDQWRWKVFNGDIKTDELNRKWWEKRLKYQGICPPVKRTEEDFDIGSKYHVPANTPYIRYFVSFVIQFQFHQALCDASGFKGPLHKCDIYRSKEAGELLSGMLKMGKSRPWPEAMEKLTDTVKMDARPLLEFFKPLSDWLEETNKNEVIGWKSEDPNICPKA